ncbi:hypothetical protein [Paenibacillus sp. SYP-B4298]|uniref:hypothetical protein n=1 Tax=Paenibacillus sp. SYP-B4298 TaxID=2996034 RepID=UPI0022DDC2C0|nr:hypothetical protein [Paenibacillus sp. SYP-B4298]
MQIGRKLYYDKSSGKILVDTGQRSGNVVPTTTEQDFAVYGSLAERIPDTVGLLELEYGAYEQDFAESSGYRVDPETKQIFFSYPDSDAIAKA